ncbi:MAG: hypothetical protein QOI22_555 [Verrucomicrobiota bacterium]
MNQANDRRVATPVLAAGIIAITLVSGCEKFEAREVMATVFFARGNAVAGDGQQISKKSHPIAVGSSIPVGNQIQTSRDTVVALSLIPGISIEVESETDLGIEHLRIAKDGDAMVDAMRSGFALIRLKNGVIRASLLQMGSSRCEFQVQTKQGTVIARPGAIFSLRADAETLRVICLRGETSWRDSHDSSFHQIPAGYYRDYTSGRAGSLLIALEDPRVAEEAVAALDTASFLESLELLARNAPAPWRHR